MSRSVEKSLPVFIRLTLLFFTPSHVRPNCAQRCANSPAGVCIMKTKTMNTTSIEPTSAELERQKNAFIEKLIEIVRKQEKAPIPESPKEQDQNESGCNSK